MNVVLSLSLVPSAFPPEYGDKKSTRRCFYQFPDMVREVKK